ncbi:hypothetical protein ElyMa_004314500 [Elysia marginata]|uniref:Shugoshin C-terminal domain-containing protein n=1 Tax=Elysia marginata TaxID=1093978 RepID=A0AAV4H241_9GAST|nr:hypothetical protein ElyMa_004314500 [Elysia marginata]
MHSPSLLRELGPTPRSYRKDTSNEKPPRRFTSRDINLANTERTPRTKNHFAASRVENANYEDTGRKTSKSNEKPFNKLRRYRKENI